MNYSSEEFNALFGEAISRGGETLQKVGEVTGLYIQDKLRENAFSRKILPPQVVTVPELTRNTTDEGLVYIDDLEPDSLAMQINMRGEPEKTYIEAKRYSIGFSLIASDEFQKTESELRSYRMPLTRVIEQNTVKDIQEQEDKVFMSHVRVGLMLATRRRLNEMIERGQVLHEGDNLTATTGKNFASKEAFASYIFTRNVADLAEGGAITDNVTSPATHTWDSNFDAAHANYNPVNAQYSNILVSTETNFRRTVLRDAVKIQAGRAMVCKTFLMHEMDWADTVAWIESDAGLEITSEIVRDGYKYSTVAGYTFVTTVRDNPAIVEPGQIYTFPSPEMLGRFLLLEGTKFFIDKRGRFISMQAWEEIGMGFGNIKGLGLILLNGASVQLPNIWQNTAGTDLNTVGTFRFYNNPDDPFVA